MVLSRISYHYNSHVRQTRRGRTAFTPPRAPRCVGHARGALPSTLSPHTPPPPSSQVLVLRRARNLMAASAFQHFNAHAKSFSRQRRAPAEDQHAPCMHSSLT